MQHRDTKEFYEDQQVRVAPGQMAFIKEHAGNAILDVAAATGDYVAALIKDGFKAEGVDINANYVKIAQKNGLPVSVGDGSKLKFKDNSFDTVIMFELMEHIEDQKTRLKIMKEAKRVARKNVLITTPNSNHLQLLKECGLTYEHMMELDHKVFWTDELIKKETDKVFPENTIINAEEIDDRLFNQLFTLEQRTWMRRGIKLGRAGAYEPKLFFRYYVVGDATV